MRTRLDMVSRFLLVALPLTAACDCKGGKAVTLKGDDVVLAEVDGKKITQYDVDRAIADTLGRYGSSRLDAEARKKVLQSLVQSRAIARAQEKVLSPEQRAVLDKKVAAYREEMLVKEYLAQNAPDKGVSKEEVQKYYDEHPERFGGKTLRSYELISTDRLTSAQRGPVLEALGNVGEQADWQEVVARLKQSGLPVSLRRGQADDQVLHPKLRKLMAQLAVNQSSKLTLVEGRAYVARITAERKQPPKALSEVSAEIRKTLAPLSLRDSVEKATKLVMEEAEVAYR